MTPPAHLTTRARTAGTEPAGPDRISLSRGTWLALTGAFVVLAALLTLTAITLISQREKTVLLNRQLGTLVTEAAVALHGVAPALQALPAHGSTITARSRAAARLVSEARPLVGQLNDVALPQTVAATGQLVASLMQQGRLISTLDNVGALASAANRSALVAHLGQLLDELPAASALISRLRGLTSSIQQSHLVWRAARGLDDLNTLVRLQTQSLRVSRATLQTSRGTRAVAARTLATARTVSATAQRLLGVAIQTLEHAASLDRKVGPVP